MHKASKILIALIMIITVLSVSPTNVYAAEEVVFTTTDSEYGVYDESHPLISIIEIDGKERTVYFTSYEGYYLDENQNKIVVVSIREIPAIANAFSNRAIRRAPSISTFYNDFYYTGSANDHFIKVDLNPTLSFTINTVIDIITNAVMSYFGIPGIAVDYIKRAAGAVASAVLNSPPDYAVFVDVEYYSNKRCSSYLFGKTYKLKSNMSAGKFYSYNWTENPSLGTVSTSCKVASQTYTYPAGYGN